MKLGDKLDLNCTANIGSDPNATVSLLSTSPFSNGKLIHTKDSQGAAIKGGDCQYMQSVTTSHVIDASDKSMDNISYQCRVDANTPDGALKVVKSDVFFVEICEYNEDETLFPVFSCVIRIITEHLPFCNE
jgi:hypothetical protein